MSRVSDAERGARIALAIAADRRDQPDLFVDAPGPEFWQGIVVAACAQLDDSAAMRAAVEGRRIPSFCGHA